jgi:hypothetical protein
VKQVLHDLVRLEAAGLLDTLLESPRDFSLAAVALFDRPMAAVAGQSLRKADRPLWKKVDRLFTIRNAIGPSSERRT